jgi:hypothetical protein
VSPKDIAFISTSEIRAFHARELNATGPSTGVNELRILSNRNLPRVAMRINHHRSSVSAVPMHRRVTHLGTSLRKRASATKSLACHPRRSFSTTRAHRATHYDTLSIPTNASRGQIKVSSTLYHLSRVPPFRVSLMHTP